MSPTAIPLLRQPVKISGYSKRGLSQFLKESSNASAQRTLLLLGSPTAPNRSACTSSNLHLQAGAQALAAAVSYFLTLLATCLSGILLRSCFLEETAGSLCRSRIGLPFSACAGLRPPSKSLPGLRLWDRGGSGLLPRTERKPAHRKSGNAGNGSLQTLSVFFFFLGRGGETRCLCCRGSAARCLVPVSVCWRANFSRWPPTVEA